MFSSFANSYENVNSQAFADFYHAYNIQQNLAGLKQSNASSSNTSTVATGTVLRIADGGAIQSQMEDLQKQIQILEAIAITVRRQSNARGLCRLQCIHSLALERKGPGTRLRSCCRPACTTYPSGHALADVLAPAP